MSIRCPDGETLKDSSYRLVGLCPALVAGVGGNGHHGLDLGGTGHDAAHGDEVADAVGAHAPDHLGLGRSGRLEVHLAMDGKTISL